MLLPVLPQAVFFLLILARLKDFPSIVKFVVRTASLMNFH